MLQVFWGHCLQSLKCKYWLRGHPWWWKVVCECVHVCMHACSVVSGCYTPMCVCSWCYPVHWGSYGWRVMLQGWQTLFLFTPHQCGFQHAWSKQKFKYKWASFLLRGRKDLCLWVTEDWTEAKYTSSYWFKERKIKSFFKKQEPVSSPGWVCVCVGGGSAASGSPGGWEPG